MSASLKNLIMNPQDRKKRQDEKRSLLLRFLRQHIWSTQCILQQVIGLSSRQSAHKFLTSLEQKGLLRRYTYDALGGRVTLWGITYQGQSLAFDLETESLIPAYFEPSRVSQQTIYHQLDLQRLRLVAESNGWQNWQDGDRLVMQDKSQKRPDAIAQDANGHLVAVECERTFKSPKRYELILLEYLKLIKSGAINHVVWVCPAHDMAMRLRKILISITSLKVEGKKVQIEPEKHHIHLHFCAYEVWPHYVRN